MVCYAISLILIMLRLFVYSNQCANIIDYNVCVYAARLLQYLLSCDIVVLLFCYASVSRCPSCPCSTHFVD